MCCLKVRLFRRHNGRQGDSSRRAALAAIDAESRGAQAGRGAAVVQGVAARREEAAGPRRLRDGPGPLSGRGGGAGRRRVVAVDVVEVDGLDLASDLDFAVVAGGFWWTGVC